jgi:tellurite resistance protein
VARADGEVSPREYEMLIELLSRLGGNAASFAELQEWLENGPPGCTVKMPEDHIRLFLREAIAVAHADGKVDQSELDTIKRIASQCIEE